MSSESLLAWVAVVLAPPIMRLFGSLNLLIRLQYYLITQKSTHMDQQQTEMAAIYIIESMNPIEGPSSLLDMYRERLSHLQTTISSLHAQIKTDNSVVLMQKEPSLDKYQVDRINELVREIVGDERQSILIYCLEQYHNLRQEHHEVMTRVKLHGLNGAANCNPQRATQTTEEEIRDVRTKQQLRLAKQEIQNLSEELDGIKLLNGSQARRPNDASHVPTSLAQLKSIQVLKTSLQSVIASLTMENKRIHEDLKRSSGLLTEEKQNTQSVQQRLARQMEGQTQIIAKLRSELQLKTSELSKLQRQLQEAEGDSLTQKIYLSDKYSQLHRNKSLQSVKLQHNNINDFRTKTKFRVAEFQELCYEMGKQEQQLKAIRSNFGKLGTHIKAGVKSNLTHLRKNLANLRSTVQTQVREVQCQMVKFVELFASKAGRILTQQKKTNLQKIERVKSLYQQQIILMDQKRKLQQTQENRIIRDAQVKIRDQRIQQLVAQVNQIKKVESLYNELLIAHQQLSQRNELRRQVDPRPVLVSPVSQMVPVQYMNLPLLPQSRSISPMGISNLLRPQSPKITQSRVNSQRWRQSSQQSGVNPETVVEIPIKDSHARKQLENGFNELQDQIQAIIERRSKRNARNNLKY